MTKDILKITNDLNIGAEGKDVEVLQTFLESEGYLTIPLEVKRGYFGSLTKAALARYQASIGLESNGYFGLLTRAVIREGMLHDHLGLRRHHAYQIA